MELNDAYVLELADRTKGFAATWNGERAEAHVAAKLEDARKAFTVNDIDSTPDSVLDQHDEKARRDWDRDAQLSGLGIEIELDAASGIVADRIEEAMTLKPTVEPLVTRAERQFEEIASMMAEERLRALFKEQTRQKALDLYERADEQTQTGRRLVVLLEASWKTVTFRDDPDHDAIAISQLRAAMETRRLARVPKELLEWRGHLQRAQGNVAFSETLRHLRSGRGIARRPKPLTVGVV